MQPYGPTGGLHGMGQSFRAVSPEKQPVSEEKE